MFIDRLTSSSWHKAKGLLVSVLTLGSISSAPAFAQVVNEPPLTPPNTSDNGPKTYYVSKNGNNTDGRSWATAWNEMDQVKWSQINLINNYHGADRIVLDGGARRMIYRTPLKVQTTGAAYFGFSISVSTEAGHNGQCVIAPPADSKGIEIANNAGLNLNGSKRSGILVYGAKDGLHVSGGAPFPITVSNVEISHCSEAGVVASSPYYPIGMNQLIIHDNATNVIVPTSGPTPGGPRFDKCWIYNSTYHRADSDGIRIDGGSGYMPPIPSISVTNSVLGPGLRDAVSNNSSSSPSLTNCLIINSTRNNFSGRAVRMENVTSFMTRLNPRGMAHAALKLVAPSTPYPPYPAGWVKKSIVFGGMVDVPTSIPGYPYYPPGNQTMVPFPLTVENNTQFRTTGNTTLLSPSMVDPKFAHPVGLLPAQTPIPLLMQMDFSLRSDSPAAGTGSTITSIRSLLNSFN